MKKRFIKLFAGLMALTMVFGAIPAYAGSTGLGADNAVTYGDDGVLTPNSLGDQQSTTVEYEVDEVIIPWFTVTIPSTIHIHQGDQDAEPYEFPISIEFKGSAPSGYAVNIDIRRDEREYNREPAPNDPGDPGDLNPWQNLNDMRLKLGNVEIEYGLFGNRRQDPGDTIWREDHNSRIDPFDRSYVMGAVAGDLLDPGNPSLGSGKSQNFYIFIDSGNRMTAAQSIGVYTGTLTFNIHVDAN
jgi:hypothetical protein